MMPAGRRIFSFYSMLSTHSDSSDTAALKCRLHVRAQHLAAPANQNPAQRYFGVWMGRPGDGWRPFHTMSVQLSLAPLFFSVYSELINVLPPV